MHPILGMASGSTNFSDGGSSSQQGQKYVLMRPASTPYRFGTRTCIPKYSSA